MDPGPAIIGNLVWVFMGGSRVGHHRRIQGGSSWEDPGWVIMGGSRVGNNRGIQGESSWEDPG